MLPPFSKRESVGTGIIRESLSGEEDPAGMEKDALEAEMMSALVGYWQDQKIRIQRALEPRIPEDRKGGIQLPLPFWAGEERSLLSILLPFLQRGAEGGVAIQQGIVESMGIGIDWTLPFTEAADWARKYGGKLVRGVTRTTRDRIGVQVGNWIEQPDKTLDDLWRAIMDDHAFSRARARLIAITETTAAYARGEMEAAGQLEKEGYFEYMKQWQTASDDRVCPICAPLQGTDVLGTRGVFDSRIGPLKGPPAHPGCRCWVNMIPRVPNA